MRVGVASRLFTCRCSRWASSVCATKSARCSLPPSPITRAVPMLGRRSEVTTSFDDDAVQDSSCVLPPSPLLDAACGMRSSMLVRTARPRCAPSRAHFGAWCGGPLVSKFSTHAGRSAYTALAPLSLYTACAWTYYTCVRYTHRSELGGSSSLSLSLALPCTMCCTPISDRRARWRRRCPRSPTP